MIDPVTAFAAANALFKGIQKGIAMGREVESMAGSISKWYGMAADIRTADKKKKKPSAFKKFMDSGSVEQEALDSMLRERKLAEMEKTLYEMILLQYGKAFYNEMIARRRQIKDERERAEREAKEQRDMFIIAGVLIAGVAAMGWLFWLLIKQANG